MATAINPNTQLEGDGRWPVRLSQIISPSLAAATSNTTQGSHLLRIEEVGIALYFTCKSGEVHADYLRLVHARARFDLRTLQLSLDKFKLPPL